MHFRYSSPLLLLVLLMRAVETKGHEQKYLQDVFRALDLHGTEDEPKLQRRHIGVLINAVLQAVHCTEQFDFSNDACEKVRPQS